VRALALSAALVGAWLVLGYALLELLRPLGPAVRRALLAPAAGLAVAVLALYWLSVTGRPVGAFGRPLAIALLAAAGATLAWRRPRFPARAWLPFAAALLASLGLVGWPMLAAGFGWLGYLNDDMANYAMLAARVLRHGLLDVPDPATLAEGRDHTLHYWWQDVLGARPGNHLLLAWVASLTGLTVHQVFMPTIVALQLVLVSAVSGLVYRAARHRPAARATAWLAAASPLVTLGTVHQLIAQAAGLGLLFALTALCLRRLRGRWLAHRLPALAAAGAVASALALVYPEVLPFFVLALAAWSLVAARRDARRLGWTAATLAVAALAVLPGGYLAKFRAYLVHQVRAGLTLDAAPGAARDAVALFPDYLVPKGLAVLWGWQVRGGAPGVEPWATLTILAGGALLAVAVAAAVRQALRGEPAASLSAGMLALAAVLFAGRAAFGLFKLAMYVQPLLLAGLATLAERAAGPRAWPRVGLALLALSGLFAQVAYVRASRGAPGEDPSDAVRRLVAEVPGDRVDLDTVEPFRVKLQALQLVGRSAVYRGRDVFARLRGSFDPEAARRLGVSPAGVAQVAAARAALEERTRRIAFPLQDPARPDLVGVAYLRDRAPVGAGPAGDDCDLLVLSARRDSPLNRRRPAVAPDGSPAVRPCAAVHDHLLFVWSDLGQHYYLARDARRIGLFQAEDDPLFAGGRMAAVGRYLLLEAFRPAEPVRLSVALSTSFLGGPDRPLPPAAVVGEERVPLPLVGQGSARVFSAPVRPREVAGRRYLALDLGVEPRHPGGRRTRAGLYGADIPADPRWVAAFARDISLVPEGEYTALRRPRRVVRFPADLADPALEYSGVAEDGWVADVAVLVLGGAPGPARLRIRGDVPRIGDPGFRTDLEVAVSGQVCWRGAVGVGPFEVSVPVRAAARTPVELRFSRLQPLRRADGRRAAAHLREIALEAPSR
jgi:hypothetical protein